MRLLHVVPTYLPATRYGGPIVSVHALCRALAARGHDVEVFTTNIDGPNDSHVPLGIPVDLQGVKVWYFASRRLRRLSFAPSLADRFLRQVPNADMVHLHSVFLWPTWRAGRIARNAHVPYVLSPRGMLIRKAFARRNRWLKSAWVEIAEKPNLQGAGAIHVTSRLEADEMQTFGWRLPRVAIVPNGVEGAHVGPAQGAPASDLASFAREQPLVLFLGRISRIKGLDRLLRGFARTKLGILAIVGPDDEGLTPELVRLARELEIGHRVRFVPRTVTGADKEWLLRSAKVFVLPSYSESFGNAVLEALRHGVPVVATAEVGAADVVSACGGGIVAAGDPDAIARAIDDLTGNPGRARSMGEAGRRHVQQHYSWAGVAAQMETLYRQIQSRQ